jgi:acyl-CoA synthetase (NDP forming)
MAETSAPDFDTMFFPKTVAVIGVSKNPTGGFKYYQALQHAGFMAAGNQVFLINPNYEEIFGVPVYPDVRDPRLPATIDLAIIAVKAENVPGVIEDIEGVVKFAVIYSSGFIESGNRELDDILQKALAGKTTRYLGPNCLGIHHPAGRLTYFAGMLTMPGPVSIVSQSGGNTARSFIMLNSLGIGTAKAISIGNQADITVADLLRYYRDDDATTTTCLYMESVPDGRDFMTAARAHTAKKPVIVWKGGQTDVGAQATASHTGGLAGSYRLWESACKQCGILLADHFEYFIDLTIACSLNPPQPLPKSKKVGIVVAGGGLAVEIADVAIRLGLEVPVLDSATQAKLGEVFPHENTSFRNPVDLGEWGYVPTKYAEALRIVAEDPNVGSLIFVREPERFKIYGKIFKIDNMQEVTIGLLKQVAQTTGKPLFGNPSANEDGLEALEARHNFQVAMLASGIPVMNYIPNICRVIKALYEYGQYQVHL